jgi:hypothetical protein
MSFINNHPILARFAALPYALTLGLQSSLSIPYGGLANGVNAIGLAIFEITPDDLGWKDLSRFPTSFGLGIASITVLAFSPVLSPIAGAAKATEVFFKIMIDPENFKNE